MCPEPRKELKIVQKASDYFDGINLFIRLDDEGVPVHIPAEEALRLHKMLREWLKKWS